MGDYPGGWAWRNWYMRVPLPEQWADTSEAFRDRVMGLWIRESKSDAWTYSQLLELFGEIHEGGTVPPALQAWVNEEFLKQNKILNRNKTQVGRPTDPQGDFRTLMAEIFLCEGFGWSKRRAHREIAKLRWSERANDGTKTGRYKMRAPGTVEASARRARGRPPGA